MNAIVDKTPFEQWHYAHGENTQGIPWVDKLVKSAWDAGLEEAAKLCESEYDKWDNDRPLRICATAIRSLK